MSLPIVNSDEVERERLRLLSELAAEQGPDWEAEYRPGSSGCHELLDRTSLFADMVEQHLLTHPACVAKSEWYLLAEQALTALRDLYQQVGAEHLGGEQEKPASC